MEAFLSSDMLFTVWWYELYQHSISLAFQMHVLPALLSPHPPNTLSFTKGRILINEFFLPKR